jgi:DNA gyrase/topoisomerase IV subunit B
MQSILGAVIKTLVLYSLAEVQLGHARSIRVEVSGQSFSVEDDGRGHSIEKTIEGAPYLQFIYTHLDYPFGEAESKSIQLQGQGMSLLNCLCTRLAVLVQKPAASLELAFQDGRLVHQEYREVPSNRTGNNVSGEVSSIGGVAMLDMQVLEEWLSSVAAVTPSLALYFNGRLLQPRP